MKIILSILIAFLLIAILPNTAHAYGGGGVTPPAYDNPHLPVTITCTTEVRKLPFNREITVPRCSVVRNNIYREYNNDFNSRLKDFIARLRNGGR
jgi:hypothetical protein